MIDNTAAAVEELRRRIPTRPLVGIITGSGLSAVADRLEAAIRVVWADIPGLPVPQVPGHTGQLVAGTLGGVPVAVMKGRVHFYEGYTMEQVGLPVRILHGLGAKTVILTNASGGLNPSLRQGDLAAITDHINLPGMSGNSPLIGNGFSGMDRFVAMTDAYDPQLISAAQSAAESLGFSLPEAVYAMVAGPSFETPAELRFLRMAGADLVGMSTVPEVVMARYLGLRVLAISCVTNTALAPEGAPTPTHEKMLHEEVLSVAIAAAPRLTALIESVVKRLSDLGRS
jgi:purine-nucleoside phosphorylase